MGPTKFPLGPYQVYSGAHKFHKCGPTSFPMGTHDIPTGAPPDSL